MNPAGLKRFPSKDGPAATMDRLVAAIKGRGMAVLARIDHAGAARDVGLELRPTEVVLFGNPKAGTPLMQAVQTLGIDLPLKALVYEDADGKTWIAVNDPFWLAARHGVQGAEQALAAMSAVVTAVASEAASG